MRAFISYAREDAALADLLRASLKKYDIEAWWDGEIGAGAVFSESIVRAIEAADVFVLLLSEHSATSEFVARELHVAFERRRFILPIIRGAIEIPRSMVLQLAGIQWLTWPPAKKDVPDLAATVRSRAELDEGAADRWLPDYVESVTVTAPQDHIFRIICAIGDYPRWHSGALDTKVLATSAEGLPVRATWTIGVPLIKALQLSYTLNYSYSPPRGCFFAAEPSSVIRELRGAYQLVRVSPSSTQVVCGLNLRLKVPAVLSQQIARIITARMLTDLKAHAEHLQAAGLPSREEPTLEAAPFPVPLRRASMPRRTRRTGSGPRQGGGRRTRPK